MTDNDKIKFVHNIALVAGIFCSVVALLLLLNYLQLSQSDPIESEALEVLIARLKEEPDNDGLKNEIRNFDLLARKAYFNSQWQVKTGAYILLIGAIILAVALRVYYAMKAKIEEPGKVLENEIAGRILAQKGIVIVGAVVFILAFAASFATIDYLDKYDWKIASVEVTEQDTEEEIEIIEIVKVKTESLETSTETEKTEAEESGMTKDTEPEREQPVEEISVTSLTLDQIRNNHNSFRGPLGHGVVYHKNIPTEWDGVTGSNILWKSPVPRPGFNSPVVWGDRIFVAGADEQNREVYCYNSKDGKLIWTGKADNIPGSPSSPPRVTEDTGLSAPTVTTDGKRVFAIFATGDIIAFDIDGQRLWAKNLGVPDNHYGHSSSLITWDDKVFVQYDTNKGAKVMALEGANGETVWETNRNAKISWASPVLVEVEGDYQLVLTADPIVAGYDIQSGKELWAVDCMMGEVGPSVGFSEGIVYAANEYARMVAIDIETQEILWEDDMYLPEASSPLAHNGLLVIATSYGVVVCYDAKTGEQYWEHDVGRTLYSSPMFADGKLFIMANDGVIYIYEFSKEMNLVAENELGETTGTTPAFAKGRIYLRGEEHLYCIGK